METTSELCLQEIMAALEAEYTGTLPEAAMRAAQRQPEAITPLLIESICKAAASVRAGNGVPSDAALFAIFLLTEFRAKEALPVILEALSLPGEGPFDLFGDAITEDLSGALAVLAVDTPAVVDDLIANPSINLYVRWAAAGTYLHWVRDGRISRDHAVQRLSAHLQQAIAAGDVDTVSGLVSELVSYAPREARELIKEAFDRDLVDESFLGFDYVEESIAGGELWVQKELERRPPSGVADAVAELSDWSAFQGPDADREAMDSQSDADWDWPFEDVAEEREADAWTSVGTIRHTAPRVSRNDPCPRGSGRKFKKCCGVR